MGIWQGTLEDLVTTPDAPGRADPAFWRGRRVFLTGHTGFKGGWLAVWLRALGAEVSGFALDPSTEPNFFKHVARSQLHDSRIGDIRELDTLRHEMRRADPEIVFHLAAQPLVRHSYVDPVGTYATNVMGTVNLLESLRACPKVRAAVIVTTDRCYENREWPWGYRENEPMGGHDPYSNSKGCAELVTAAYRASFFESGGSTTAIATARAGNVIGGGDWSKDRLVPDLLQAFEAGRSALVRNPTAVRPWQHVLEPLHGYLVLAQRLHAEGARFAEAWNFGPYDSDTQPVSWIAERLAAHWGVGSAWHTEPQSKAPHEATWLKLDCSKARQTLGWLPRWSLDRALEMIVAWHRAMLDGQDMLAYSLRQIEDYETPLIKP